MCDTVWHTATAASVLIAAFVKVACNTALWATALGLGVEANHLAKGVLRVIGKRVLIV